MIDEIAIQQVLNRYSQGCSIPDWPQVEATFLPDAEWSAGPLGTFKGWGEMYPAMSGFTAGMDFWVQFNSPAIIAVDGDRATARCLIRESGKFKDRDETLEIMGYYDDELVRTAEGWKFARREFTALGAQRFAPLPGPALG